MLKRGSLNDSLSRMLLDALLTVSALALTDLLSVPFLRLVWPDTWFHEQGEFIPVPYWVLVAVLWWIVFMLVSVYDPERNLKAVDEFQHVMVAAFFASLTLAGVLYLTRRDLSRWLFVLFLALDWALLVGWRVVARVVYRHAKSYPRRRRVLIVGAGEVGVRVAHAIELYAWSGMEIVGYLDDDEAKIGQTLEGVRVLGTLDQADTIVAEQGVREIVIALPMSAHQRLTDLVTRLSELPVNIKVVPDYSQLVFLRTTLEVFGGELLIGLKEPVIGPVDRFIKRAFDVVVASILLVVLSPIMVGIAVAVRLSSPGPALYRSQRAGEGGRLFAMLKFRTMYLGADRDEEALISETEQGDLVFDKRQDDPRVTPIGQFLRRYSLDELPQFLNVLRGDMSLVGPRPELPSLVKHYQSWQTKRFAVPQGITGWWQISGRSSKAKQMHVEDDLYYIRNYSILLDVKILLRTLGAVIRGEGAF